jgi:hypothetical protein
MTVIPNTEVRLLSGVPFNQSYEHTRKFNNEGEQSAYFLSKAQYTFLDFTYQREEQSIKVPRQYDDLYLSNYVMYRNTSFGSKWFYGFITNREYINPNTTKIFFELDVYQTWQFDMTWNPSFVEREHANRWNVDGTPVINTVDEGLSYGTEYDTSSVLQWLPFDGVYFLVIVAKKTMHGGTATAGKIVPMLNGSPQPLTYYIHPFKLDGSSPTVMSDGMDISISTISEVLTGLYTQTDAVNNIVSLYITDYIGYNNVLNGSSSYVEQATIEDANGNFNTLYLKNMPSYETKESSMGDKWAGYTPVTESKLLMSPYTQLIIDDFKGNRATFKTEYINNTELKLTVKGSIGTSNKVSYGIQDYNFDANGMKPQLSDEFALINNTPNDVPIITDLLAAYLQGNRNSLENQKAGIIWNQVFGSIGNAMTKNPMGIIHGVGNGYLQMQGLLAKQADIANTPPNITKMGSNTAYTFGNGYGGVYVIRKQIKPEYIKKLTDFFKMCGYKINEVKLPNLHTRQHFNFVKTVGANIVGNIPNNDITKIKEIFDKGVTLWHVDNVTDYSLSNGEI